MFGLARIWKRFAGRHYRKFVKSCEPIIARIHAFDEQFSGLDDEQLREKTTEFRGRVAAGESLESILPEAFAVVKNACRRLVGSTVMVCGQSQRWEMAPYDVQLIGAIALNSRKIAEMATGEGKTLVATMPLYLNALTGKNCQLVTVNDYLARRDSEWMGHLYNFLGLTVGCIQNSMNSEERRVAYGRDITYGTAAELGFDYLRDNGLAMAADEQVQRDHYFCIVDEIDSILIDEARTPLIISGPAQTDRLAPFKELEPAIERLVRLQTQLCNRLILEAREKLAKNPGDPSVLRLLFQVHLGMPKHRQLLKLLENGSLQKQLERFQGEMTSELRRDEQFRLKEELYFTVEERQNSADLTERGRQTLYPENPDAFVLPDLTTLFSEIDHDSTKSFQEKTLQRQRLEAESQIIGQQIHCIGQLLKAHTLFERDRQYIVAEGQILIVDPNTGRAMPGRRWSDGLHQAIEAKEHLAIQGENRTFASITIQNYFRLYEKLAGMTGTAETEAQEFHDIYGLTVVLIPTNRPCRRIDENDVIYKTRREKYLAVLEDIGAAHERGQPILVGTTSVDASELLSKMLQHNKLPHSVLNAKYHEAEANIIARAGQRGAITIATNMAGRGTDIKLGEGVNELGGLKVLGTERHESRRIDRQLRGRCARQGDNGSSKFFISLEDDLMRLFASRGPISALLDRTFKEGDVLAHPLLNRSIANAQKKVEQQNYAIRKRLLEYDDVLNRQREVIYLLRNDMLRADDPLPIIWDLLEEEIRETIEKSESPAAAIDKLNYLFPLNLDLNILDRPTANDCVAAVMDRLQLTYRAKQAVEERNQLQQLERLTFLQSLDRRWQDHLSQMEDLRRNVGLRGYAQKNPLYEYKAEAFTSFEELIRAIRQDTAFLLFRSASNEAAFQSLLKRLKEQNFSDGPAATRTGPNDRCSCGSGKKHRKCCGK